MTGADTKFWEDVNFGDVVGPAIKGTLGVRDELVWLMVAGSPFLRAHKNEFDYEAKHRHWQKDSQLLSDYFNVWGKGYISIGETPFQPQVDKHTALLARARSD